MIVMKKVGREISEAPRTAHRKFSWGELLPHILPPKPGCPTVDYQERTAIRQITEISCGPHFLRMELTVPCGEISRV